MGIVLSEMIMAKGSKQAEGYRIQKHVGLKAMSDKSV
jgi:hypothetical protein